MNKTKRKASRLLMTILITAYALVSLYPIIWLFLQSFKSDAEFFQNMYSMSLHPRFMNYLDAWNKANFGVYYKNSIFVTGVSIFLVTFTCSVASYAFVKVNFIGKKILMVTLVIILFMPGTVLLFPVFLMVRDLGIYNSYAGLIGPYVSGAIPVSILVMNNAFGSIPKEISESARIDGCGHYRALWTVMMPLVKPSISTVAILAFIGIWNEYMWALISLNNKKLFTLPIGIADISAKAYSFGFGTVFAGMIMTTGPVVLLYIILQKQFVKALTAGSVKG
jgi:ABC-type glycerol-3-phosphate transport system permease component